MATTYLLDTNTISYLADRASEFHGTVSQAVRDLPPGSAIAIAILTHYELTYGFLHHPLHAKLTSILREEGIRIVPLTEAGAAIFAELKRAYRKRTGARETALGRHNIDLILASTAIVEGAVLVSNDRLFTALAELEPRLVVENRAG